MAGRQPKTSRFDQLERQPRLSERVADMLLETILSDDLKPGDRLPSERELGDQFGVSRTVIREAVGALVAKGVLDVKSGSGLHVAERSASAMTESMSLFLRASSVAFENVHAVRRVIEVHIAGLAAENRTDADLVEMKASCAAMERAIDGRDVENAAILDLEFHRTIARSTQNQLFLALMDSIGQSLIDLRRQNLSTEGNAMHTRALHRQILDAVAAGDPERAREAMSAHLDYVESVWRAWSDEADEVGG
jgi:GntR family transcriptional repressor for pyruvate dehydrogenase complex